jgi:hypothetical protein
VAMCIKPLQLAISALIVAAQVLYSQFVFNIR